jgi:hypothetical protein
LLDKKLDLAQLAQEKERFHRKMSRIKSPENLRPGKRKVSQLAGLKKETSQLAVQEKERLHSLVS